MLDNNNSPITFESLVPGQTVEVRADKQGDGSYVAVRIKIEDVMLLSGTLGQVASNGLSVAEMPISLDAGTVVLGKFNQVLHPEDLSVDSL